MCNSSLTMHFFFPLYISLKNRNLYILIMNKGFGREVILDVAVTGIDNQSRTSDDAPESSLGRSLRAENVYLR